MERNPHTPAESSSHEFEHSDSSDKESTKKKRRRIAGSAVVASTHAENSTESQSIPETPKPKELSPLEQALAQLATETRRQKAAEADTPTATTDQEQTPELISPETDEAHPTAKVEGNQEFEAELVEVETTENQAEKTDGDSYEPLPDYSVGATEFSGGEIVIDLGGSSVEEHVLPLEPTEIPTAAETEEAAKPHPAHMAHDTAPHVTGPEHTPDAAPEIPVATHPDASEASAADSNEFAPPRPAAVPEFTVPAYQRVLNEVQPELTQPESTYSQPQASAETAMPMEGPNFVPTNYTRPNAAEQVITKADFDDAIHRATKAGQNRGVAAGLLVGGGYEHFKHKRREKRAAKKHQETTKKLAEARKSLAHTMEQQVKQRAEYTAHIDESDQKLATTERRLSALEQQRTVHHTAEQQKPVSVANAPQGKPHVEQAPKPVLETEPLPVAPEHQLQTSSWHSIEVDARTGRAVEKPAFEYGHEYYREQAQENALGQPPAQDTAERRTPAAQHDTSHAPAGFGSSTLPPMYSAPAPAPQKLQSTQPTPTKPQKPQPAIPTANKTVAKPTQPASPIWPLVLALVVVIICLSLVLR